MNIDIRTLFVVMVIISFLQVIAISFQYALNRTQKGIIWWLWGFILFAAAYIFFIIRYTVTLSPLLIIFGNSLSILGLAFLYIGLMLFLNKPVYRWAIVSIIAVFFLSALYFTYIYPDYTALSATASLIMSVLGYLVVFRLMKNKARSTALSTNFIIIILLVYTLFYTFRAVIVIVAGTTSSISNPGAFDGISALTPIVISLLVSFGLIILVNQRLNADIRQSKDHFERLFNASPDSITLTRLSDGRIVDVNESFAAFSGYEKKTIIGRSVSEYGLWANPAERIRMVAEVSQNGLISNYEAVFRGRDGNHFTGLMSGRIIEMNEIPHLISVTRDISERQKLLKELSDESRRLESIIEGTNAGTWEWNIQTGEIIINGIWAEILGYTLAELTPVSQQTWANLSHPDEIQTTKNLLERHFNGLIPVFDLETRMRHKDGHWVWVHARGRLVSRTEDGKPLMMFGTQTDISPRKQAEEILQKSETRFRGVFNTSPIGITLFDENWQFVQGNPAFYSILGSQNAEEIQYFHFTNLISNANEIRAQLAIKKEVKFQLVLDFDAINHQGAFRSSRVGKANLDVIITPLAMPADIGISGYLIQIQEITDRIRAEARLKESEEKHRLLVENSHDIIYTFNSAGLFTFVSPAWTALLGYPVELALGRSFLDFIHPDDVPDRTDWLKQIVEDKRKVFSLDYRVKHIDGSWRWHSSRIVTLLDDKGVVLAFEGSASDITERRELEEKSRQLYEHEKKQRQQLEEEAQNRIRFIDILAHELKGPLTPMLVSSEMLRDSLRDDRAASQRKMADNIFNGTRLLVDRLEELLEVARYARGVVNLNLEPVNLRRFLEQCAARFEPMVVKRHQKLVIETAVDLPVTNLDPSRIEQVLINLLSNASKYSPQASAIRLTAAKRDHDIVISVKDEGIGIAPADQVRLFQPYQRVGSEQMKTKGLGLGLTVVKYIVEAHGGQIWLVSQPGQGSTFSFSIPIK